MSCVLSAIIASGIIAAAAVIVIGAAIWMASTIINLQGREK